MFSNREAVFVVLSKQLQEPAHFSEHQQRTAMKTVGCCYPHLSLLRASLFARFDIGSVEEKRKSKGPDSLFILIYSIHHHEILPKINPVRITLGTPNLHPEE